MEFYEIQKAPNLIYSSFTEILASNTEKKIENSFFCNLH